MSRRNTVESIAAIHNACPFVFSVHRAALLQCGSKEAMRGTAHVSENVIEIRNLSKLLGFLGTSEDQSARLELNAAKFFGLLDANGSGKTTTLKLLLGLLFPTEGQVKILGKPAHDVEKNECIGVSPGRSLPLSFFSNQTKRLISMGGSSKCLPPSVMCDAHQSESN